MDVEAAARFDRVRWGLTRLRLVWFPIGGLVPVEQSDGVAAH